MKTDNESAVISGAQLIVFFTISLLFTSVVVSWMILNAYGVAITGLPFTPMSSNTLDFTQSVDTGINAAKTEGGAWDYNSGIGKIATA